METLTIETLTEHAETIKNDAAHDMANLEPCEQWVQGDVRVVRLPDSFDVAKHCEPIAKFGGQVAPGNTLGSRHVLDSLSGVTAYRLRNGNAIDGPVIVTTEPRTLTHPEHGDCVGMPAGLYAFPGQRVYADELRRVMD